MSKYALRTVFLLICLLLPNQLLAGERLSDILKGVRDRYGHLPALSVTYEREIETQSMAALGGDMGSELATGKIYFKSPHFVRVEQETPTPETVIADGRSLWWYIPEKKQAHRFPAHKLGEELKLLTDIFQGLRDVKERFDVTLEGEDPMGRYQLRLTPDPPWPQVNQIGVSVAKETYLIGVLEIRNQLGGLTRFTLDSPVAQRELEEEFFEFMVPAGVRVISEE